MKHVQMLTHEIGTGCNLADAHKRCPINIVNRPGSTPMSDDVISKNIEYIYRLGFKGMCSWYYYCEPTLYLHRIEKIVDMVKDVPGVRHLLWTNGILLKDLRHRLKIFSKVVISNYEKTDWSWVSQYVPETMVVNGILDGRKTKGRRTTQKCLRPYHEIIFDYYGNLHLCCGDHQKTATHTNLMHDGSKNCVKEYLALREKVSHQLDESAPQVCFHCRVRGRNVIDQIVK